MERFAIAGFFRILQAPDWPCHDIKGTDMNRAFSLPLLAALLLTGTACSSTRTAPAAPAPEARACPAPLVPAVEHQIYFGRALGTRGEVTEAQWTRFVAEVVTPRFPDGLSVLDVAGQSREGGSNRTLRERTKLLIVVVPVPGASHTDSRIEDVAAAYRTRFNQRAVFRVDRPVCASL
jgi:hypothetical protein